MVDELRQAVGTQARLARAGFLDLLEARRAATVESTMLRRLIAANAQTAFGREHGFGSIESIRDFRRAVPIRHYEGLKPWIDRTATGESGVLTTEDPVRFWKTTGTTSEPKRIPVTPTAAARVMESFLTLQGTQLAYYPELNDRADTSLVTHLSPKRIKEHLGGGRYPYCSTTEVPIEVRPGQESLFSPWMIPLQEVVEDDAERLYFLLLFASLHDLYAIFCLHPSRFQTLAAALEHSWPRIVRELHDGTLLGVAAREPRPDRARELEAIAARDGRLHPRDVWPNLRVISSWSGSYISRYRPVMTAAYCDSFLAMPSISSECFVTMTIDDDPIGQPLNIRGGLFEFIPSGQPVEAGSETRSFSELTVGETYELVLTTHAGLYRYAMCDIFRVTGHIHDVPRLEYVGRRSVSDLTGEKLAEEQVADVVTAALAAARLPVAMFTVCGIDSSRPPERPRYVLVLETDADWPRARWDELAADVDRRFKQVNSRYELKRNFNDLDPVMIEPVSRGTFGRYRARLIERGAPAGQLKDKVLHPVGAPVLAQLRELSRAAKDQQDRAT